MKYYTTRMFLERSESKQKTVTNYKQGIQAYEHKIYNCAFEIDRENYTSHYVTFLRN
jgi:hypothetical protein